jgi:hypothetical protein
LLAKVPEVEEYEPGGHRHDDEARRLLEGRALDPFAELLDPDEVRQKDVPDQNGDGDEDPVFQDPAQREPRSVQALLARVPALDQTLDRAEDVLHVDGLRTTPAAPDPTEERAQKDDGDEDHQEEEHQEHPVRR